MNTRPLAVLALLAAPLSAADPKPADRPIPAADAAKAMTAPKGFNVTLFAGEPDVVQPIAFSFDTRGRMWVVECLSYPKWRDDGKGGDRVVILEDTDGDGKHDKRTVFLDNGCNLSGIELGFGGVWLCSMPNLLFIPVKDDKPAGPPVVVADGWTFAGTKHNVFNSLAWGPDGWLYGCNGIQCKARLGVPGTPDEKRAKIDCGVWRYHPTRKVVEAFAHGTTNPFGLDWDEYGQMFITNCVIDHMWHVVPGAHFRRMYGDDVNPYTFGLMTSCVDHLHWAGGSWTSSRSTGVGGKPEHSDAGGGHAHSGCMVYLGDQFPAEYRNNVFMCNIHGNRLNRDRLDRTPNGYVGRHEPDFLFANDPWFRGLCVKQGPDGSIYVSDWSDTGECHNYVVADQTNGRIFKVSYGTPKPLGGDLAAKSDKELAELVVSRNEWVSRQARRLLQERAAVGRGDPAAAAELHFAARKGGPAGLRAVWGLHAVRPRDLTNTQWLDNSPDDQVRGWRVRLLAENCDAPVVAEWLTDSARKETSPAVRMQYAASLQRLPDAKKFAVAEALFTRPEDNDNADLTLMYWYGIQPAVLSHPAEALKLAGKVTTKRVRENIVRLYLTRPDADTAAALAEVLTALADLGGHPAARDMLKGAQLALAGKRGDKLTAAWEKAGPALLASTDPEVRAAAEGLAVQFGDQVAIAMVLKRVRERKTYPDALRADVQLLVTHRVAAVVPVLHELLNDATLRPTAVRALAAFPDDETPALLLAAYPKLTPAEKADAVQTLAARKEFAAALLDAVEKGAVPRADVPVVAARQVLALNDKATSDRLAKVWGVIQPPAKDKDALFKKWKGVLAADAVKTADKSHGRAVFAKTCAACHKLFGEGGDGGPELTGSQRASLDYVLENVLTPNAVVPREFQVTNFVMADGRVVSGMILRETDAAVHVRTANDAVLLSKADIEARKPTNQSLMPEGIFDTLKPDEVRALVAYLGSPQQVPLPK